MAFKFDYQKNKRQRLTREQKFVLIFGVFLLFLFTVSLYTKIMIQPVELEFSGKVFGNFEIDNVRVNYIEGSWKVKAPYHLLFQTHGITKQYTPIQEGGL